MPFAPHPPIASDLGLQHDAEMIPTTPPANYVPCRGEHGFSGGGLFLPLEIPFVSLSADELPLIKTATEVDRDPPWTPVTGMAVATPHVAPYDWTAATGYNTLILDTTPDASASEVEKALPGYVANPGLTLSSRSELDFPGEIDYRWSYDGTTDPHPALRTGQTRYSGISGAATGTLWDGEPFLPATGTSLKNGTLLVRAFRKALLLSAKAIYLIKVKIGRASATWDASAQTLTLATTNTTGATIKYSLDGSTPSLTYSTPLSITETKTVRWFAQKTDMVTSDTWNTTITYDGATPPDDFETIYFSALSEFVNTPIDILLRFQRAADFYISPSGTGDGLTPSTPSDWATILGTSATAGKASGARGVTFAPNSGTKVAMTGGTIKYSTDGATFSTYSTPVTLAAPGRVWAKLIYADATDASRVFRQTWFLGTGADVNCAWDLSAKTLTLTYSETLLIADDVVLHYSLDGSTPSIPYAGPISISATCTPKIKAVHAKTGEPHDFATASAEVSPSLIDPDATPDYSEDKALTFSTTVSGSDTQAHKQPGDVVWACAGTYSNPGGTAATYFIVPDGVIARGGYTADYATRDVMNQKSNIVSVVSGGIINDHTVRVSGTLDGFWSESAVLERTVTPGGLESHIEYITSTVFYGTAGSVTHNCHATFAGDSFAGGLGSANSDLVASCRKSTISFRAFNGPGYSVCAFCTLTVDVSTGDGGAGTLYNESTQKQRGTVGGGFSLDIRGFLTYLTSSSDPLRLFYGCKVDSTIAMGDGGTGGNAGTVATYTSGNCVVVGGGGGSVDMNTWYLQGNCSYCECVLNHTGGNGGTAGNGGTLTWAGPNFTYHPMVGGVGGSTSLKCFVGDGEYRGNPYFDPWGLGTTGNWNILSGTLIGGIGGNGGNGGTRTDTTITVVEISGGAGGWSTLWAQTGFLYGIRGESAFTSTSGNGGNGGNSGAQTAPVSPARDWSVGGSGGSSTARHDVDWFITGSAEGRRAYYVDDVAVTAGNGGAVGTNGPGSHPYPQWLPVVGESRAVLNNGTAQLLCENTLTASDGSGSVTQGIVQVYPHPTEWGGSAPAISEGTILNAGGNPSRVSQSGTATSPAWYSGTVNSNGAPLTGYETPQGTGVALGDYWE